MELGKLKRVISLSKMSFDHANKDLAEAEKNYYLDIWTTKEYLKGVVNDLQRLIKEIEELI